MYDQRFYDEIRVGARRSVDAALPIIAERLGLTGNETVLDVGCGEGWWADGFARLGCTVTGIDSGHTEHRPDTFDFVDQHITGILPRGHWDLIVCLEVAEHLNHRNALALVQAFKSRTDCVLFSAARPGQGGTGHINEQPISTWAAMLHEAGFAVSGALRWYLWGDARIENWYQQNMLVAIPKTVETDAPKMLGEDLFPPTIPEQMAHPHDVVHPILFDARRTR